MAHGKPPKSPAYQWYPGDADTDEVYRLMTYEQEGVYRRLLDHQWMEGSIPADPHVLASLLPKMAAERFLQIWPLVSGKFRPKNGARLINERLESQRRTLKKFVRIQKVKSAKGVAARQLQAKNTQPAGQPVVHPAPLHGVNQRVTSSSSSSSSSLEQKIAPPANLSVMDDVSEKAGAFLRRYAEIYAEERRGAHFHLKPALHFMTACDLVRGWPDVERLELMFRTFCKLPASEKMAWPGTPAQFLHLAPSIDAKLRQAGV